MKNIVKESFNASNVSFANKLRLEDGKKKTTENDIEIPNGISIIIFIRDFNSCTCI